METGVEKVLLFLSGFALKYGKELEKVAAARIAKETLQLLGRDNGTVLHCQRDSG
jgi:hypothetical protein